MDAMIQILAKELSQDPIHVENVVKLIDEGNTIPFIARYRKELHGAMDDTALRTLADRLQYLRNLEKRRGEVKAAVDGQGKLTEALSTAIDAAATLAEVEDLYRPYKQKRRTRATVAREKGLEPLAALLFAQGRDCSEPLLVAAGYVDPEKGWRLRSRRSRAPPTSWPSRSLTTPPCVSGCGRCGGPRGS